jgi:hypothetical protein
VAGETMHAAHRKVRKAARASRDNNTSLREQLPAWVDALYQAALEMTVASNIRGPEEQASIERRAREVAARLDDVADALRRAQLAEDDEVRHEEVFEAHRALMQAEAAL